MMTRKCVMNMDRSPGHTSQHDYTWHTTMAGYTHSFGTMTIRSLGMIVNMTTPRHDSNHEINRHDSNHENTEA